jgi:phosphomevalonate kinase
VFPLALRAHEQAQGGGSGIDVAASTFGGVLRAIRENGTLVVTPIALPAGLELEVWATLTPASTADLLAKVAARKASNPEQHQQLMGRQIEASHRAVAAAEGDNLEGFLLALDAQADALSDLGSAAGANIITASTERLREHAHRHAATVLPSGAGGGDLVFYAGSAPPPAGLVALAQSLGLVPLALRLGAAGVSAR